MLYYKQTHGCIYIWLKQRTEKNVLIPLDIVKNLPMHDIKKCHKKTKQ